MEEEFSNRYGLWADAVEKMLPYSKSTAYADLEEYGDIVLLGHEAVPFLLRKLEENRDMDFLLADAVIAIEGWDPDEFPATDLEQRRLAVIARLGAA